jgi:putative phosphoribosyl transferase
MRFVDRTAAGVALASLLERFRSTTTVVVGLPRGGVPVAAEVAAALIVPLDVIVVRKLGAPSQPELAIGSIGEGGVRIINDQMVRALRVDERDIAAVETRERAVLDARSHRLRQGRLPVDLEGTTVIIVDDGLATGATAKAACAVVRAKRAQRVVLAVPVAPHDWTTEMGTWADEYVAVMTPRAFSSVGEFYDDFRPVTDEQVIESLRSRDV